MKYILFIKADCPFCVEAQNLLQERELDFEIVNFEPEDARVLQEIKSAHEWQTVPMIFEKDREVIRFIGGYTDLVSLFSDDE